MDDVYRYLGTGIGSARHKESVLAETVAQEAIESTTQTAATAKTPNGPCATQTHPPFGSLGKSIR
jgi:hypothetical protein